MASLKQRLSALVTEQMVILDLDAALGQVHWSDRPDLCQFQCNGALAAAKKLKKNPRDIATAVVEALNRVTDQGQPVFRTLEIAGPGFINLSVTDGYLAGHVQHILAQDAFGVQVSNAQTFVMDYGGPNIAKPMHVGHLRSAVIGESLKRVLRYMGHRVHADVHLGDWGLQMGMIIAEIAHRRPGLDFFQDGFNPNSRHESPVTMTDLEEIYPAAKKHGDDDPAFLEQARRVTKALQDGHPGYHALWQHFINVSVAALKTDYALLNVEFDLWYGESHAQPRIPVMIDRLKNLGVAVFSEGAWVIDVADEKKKLPPLILQKTDGAVLYSTTDLATIEQRVADFHPNTILYVVDNRQQDHFRQVFRAAYKAGIAPEDMLMEHIGFGTINGADGKPFKTREGGVMKLKNLLDMVIEKAHANIDAVGIGKDYPDQERLDIANMVGVAALKFADLMNHRTKNYVFDTDRFVSFEGKTGPYIQYTLVRGKSILRKATALGLSGSSIEAASEEKERKLQLKIAEFTDALAMVSEHRAPNHLCEFIHQFAVEFNRFYHQHHILNEKDKRRQAVWLALTQACVHVLDQALTLLAIPVPERM